MNVLSLFDGMSCGNIALERTGIHVDNYYAAEIDKHAIKVSSYNYPNTIHLGSVENWRDWGIDWSSIDLLIGGSPCQGFSSAGRQLGMEDPRSRLFYVYSDILKHLKEANPDIKFLLENVKMKKEWIEVISSELGVQPIEINSALVSAQNRVRLYWTNIENILLPVDKGILLSDILEDAVYTNPARIVGRRLNQDGIRKDSDKSIPIQQYLEVSEKTTDKSGCITTVAKDAVVSDLPSGRYWANRNKSYCIDANYAKGSNFKRYFFRGSRQIVFEDGYVPVVQSEDSANQDAVNQGNRWRTLTLKELCRLQTVPDTYFDGVVSTAQASKMLGNGWTVDVIAHIFKNLTKR